MTELRVALAVSALLGLGAVPSGADEPVRTRDVVTRYDAGAGIDCQRRLGCVKLVPRPGEQYVVFTVEDASGLPAYGTVTHQRRSSFEVFGAGDEFCGEGSYLTPDARPVYLYFENHLGSWHHCPGGATRGVVRADFYAR